MANGSNLSELASILGIRLVDVIDGVPATTEWLALLGGVAPDQIAQATFRRIGTRSFVRGGHQLPRQPSVFLADHALRERHRQGVKLRQPLAVLWPSGNDCHGQRHRLCPSAHPHHRRRNQHDSHVDFSGRAELSGAHRAFLRPSRQQADTAASRSDFPQSSGAR